MPTRTRRRVSLPRAPRQERSRFMVDNIVQATGEVLAARGIEGTTTNHVAERAGVSIGSVYQYFPDKKALIHKLLDGQVDRDMALAQRLISVQDAPLADIVRASTEALVDVHGKERELYAQLFEAIPLLERTREMQEPIEMFTQA